MLCGSERCSIMLWEYVDDLRTDPGPSSPMSSTESSSAAASKLKYEFTTSGVAMMEKGLKVCKEVGYMRCYDRASENEEDFKRDELK